MRDFLLTATQRRQLERQLQDTTDAGVFRRTLAVLEAANGRSVAEIARLLRTSRPSVYQWVHAYRHGKDPASLIDHRSSNHPTLWSPELRALLTASLAQPPDAWGYPVVEWTVPLLQEHLARCGGVRPSEGALLQEMYRQEYSWKRPRRQLPPDPDQYKKTPDSCPDSRSGTDLGQAVRG
jgi:transposase